MFDIPMSTKGAMDSSGLLALNGGTQQSAPNSQSQQQSGHRQQSSGMTNMSSMERQTQSVQQSVPKQRPQGNGVHLRKGQKFALNQNGQQPSVIKVCLGWEVNNVACDLDASAFMLNQSTQVIGDDWFVFYGQTTSPDGSVVHSGDSDGSNIGDDEVITIDTTRINPNIQKISFVVTINEALERGLNFSMVRDAYVRVVDANNNNELAKFSLTDYYANVTSMVVGELYKHNGTWKFNAIGDGVAKDLAGLCAMYGVNVAD